MNNDLIELSNQIERKVIKDGKRFFGGFFISEGKETYAATAHSAGCNVKCFYCSSMIRDYADGVVTDINLKTNKNAGVKNGYYSPEELLNIFIYMAENPGKFGAEEALNKVTEFAILDCETTIGINYVIELVRLLYEYNNKNSTGYHFQLFTNGILLGRYPEYITELAKYKECLTIRYSIKAGDSTSFSQRLDISEEYFKYPFEAIEKCIKLDITIYIAVLCDEKIMSKQEYDEIKKLLKEAGYNKDIYEESLIMSVSCITRIRDHLRKNPDFKLNFKFRDNIILAYDNSNKDNEIISNKLRVGISRVIDNKPLLVNKEDLYKLKKIPNHTNGNKSSLIYLTNLNDDRVVHVIHELSTDTLNLFNEIIILNLNNNLLERSHIEKELVGKGKIKIKNLEDLSLPKCDLAELSYIDIINAGRKLTYFWT